MGLSQGPVLGKAQETGMNLLVAGTLEGRLSWISASFGDSSVLDGVDALDYISDKRFVGN
jgi:hypothetical protein